MSEPLSFSPFLGWADVTDPQNVPPDAKVINAADLLRYEQALAQTVTKVNAISDDVVDLNVLGENGQIKPELLPTIIDGGTP